MQIALLPGGNRAGHGSARPPTDARTRGSQRTLSAHVLSARSQRTFLADTFTTSYVVSGVGGVLKRALGR